MGRRAQFEARMLASGRDPPTWSAEITRLRARRPGRPNWSARRSPGQRARPPETSAVGQQGAALTWPGGSWRFEVSPASAGQKLTFFSLQLYAFCLARNT